MSKVFPDVEGAVKSVEIELRKRDKKETTHLRALYIHKPCKGSWSTDKLNGLFPDEVELGQTECVRTHVVRARADVVASKLGIILFLFFSFFFFLPLTFLSYSADTECVRYG